MAFDYAKAQSTALRLLKQFGVTARLSRVSSGYAPVSGVQTILTITSTDCVVVNLPASNSNEFDDDFREGLRLGKNRLFYMAAKGLDFVPKASDLLTYDGQVWEIYGLTPLNPNGTPLLYNVGAVPSNVEGAILTAGDFSDDFSNDFLNANTA